MFWCRLEAVPKTEVLEQPLYNTSSRRFKGGYWIRRAAVV